MTAATLEQARTRIAELEEEVARLKRLLKLEWAPHRRLPFSEQEATVLGLLVRLGEAPRNKLFELLWGENNDGGADDPDNALKVVVHHLRRKLAPLGVEIRTLYGFGYLMSKEDRDKLKNGDLDRHFEAVRAHAKVALPRRTPVARKKVKIPVSDRPKGKWAW